MIDRPCGCRHPVYHDHDCPRAQPPSAVETTAAHRATLMVRPADPHWASETLLIGVDGLSANAVYNADVWELWERLHLAVDVIATLARTVDSDQAARATFQRREVLALHVESAGTCTTCVDEQDNPQAWPCETVRALRG